MTFQASRHQQAIFDWIDNGNGSTVVTAVAGSGKSTTLGEALVHIPEHKCVHIFAFNAPIAKDFRARIEKLSIKYGRPFAKVRATTFHSAGFGAIAKALNMPAARIETDGKKCVRLMKAFFTPVELEMYGAFATRLVSLAKGEGIGPLVADVPDAWWRLIQHHDLSLDSLDASEEAGIEIARRLLAKSNEVAKQGHIDFDDQLYLPILWRLRLWQNDWVFIDEAQDTNPIRRAIAKLALRPGGRLVAVGDARQAIYGFCHPAGTPILTASGPKPIETLKKGDSVIIGDTSGNTSGWSGNQQVLETHIFEHNGYLLTLSAGHRTVEMTPHHKVPVRIGSDPYYTYMMCRNGVYRVGYCKAFTRAGDFMLTHRFLTEQADAAWLIEAHPSKEAARAAESVLLKSVKGTTFNNKTDAQIADMPTDDAAALRILSLHRRMVDFPLLHAQVKHRISRKGPFVTEACNILPGMAVAFYDDMQRDMRVRGRGRQTYAWTGCSISYRMFTGKVYGITVPAISTRSTSSPWNLYYGGFGQILVHNTGASHDAIDLIKREFNATELPLTVSYRCAQSISKYAAELVPYFEAFEGAPAGKVEFDVPLEDALKALGSQDAILCRNVAPLIELAYDLIARGIGCRVLGREIGDGLTSLVKKMKARGCDMLQAKLEAYRDREVAKFMAKGEEGKAEGLEDRVSCILTVMGRLNETERTVPALVAKIESLFSDDGNGMLVLSSIHKAKGREWRVVAIIRRDLMPSRYARQNWQRAQEENLDYVSRTRAIEHLMYVEC